MSEFETKPINKKSTWNNGKKHHHIGMPLKRPFLDPNKKIVGGVKHTDHRTIKANTATK